MGLLDFDYAVYTAIANTDSVRELMGNEKLREFAVVVYENITATTPIDRTIKERVNAQLNVLVTRTLRQYGSPPDMQR